MVLIYLGLETGYLYPYIASVNKFGTIKIIICYYSFYLLIVQEIGRFYYAMCVPLLHRIRELLLDERCHISFRFLGYHRGFNCCLVSFLDESIFI